MFPIEKVLRFLGYMALFAGIILMVLQAMKLIPFEPSAIAIKWIWIGFFCYLLAGLVAVFKRA